MMADNPCLSVNVFAITFSVNLSVTLFGHAIATTFPYLIKTFIAIFLQVFSWRLDPEQLRRVRD